MNFKFKTAPFKHQLDNINRFRDAKYAAIFWDMGLGKTKFAIDFLRLKCYQNKRKLSCLIIAPVATLPGWKKELGLHSALIEDAEYLTGSKAQKIKKLKLKSKIYIVNYESLKSLWQYLAVPWDMLIIDESHKIKGTDTQRSKLVVQLSGLATYRILLSGTPILNNPMDIFNQYLALDRGATFGDNFFHFRNIYFEDVNARWKMKYPEKYFPKFEPIKGVYDMLITKIRGNASIIQDKNECLDLPPAIYTTMELEMTKEMEKAYYDMAELMIAEIDAKTAEGWPEATVASTAVTKLIRLRQITSGFMVSDNDGKKIRLKSNPKLDAIKEFMETIGSEDKVVIWACFHEDIDMLVEDLSRYGVAQIHGRVSNKQEELKKFRDNKKCRVCVGHPKSGGTGINELVGAKFMIYYSQDYSLESRLQSEARVHRKGSEIHDKITYVDLVYKETIDGVIIDNLKNKKDMSAEILVKTIKEVRDSVGK